MDLTVLKIDLVDLKRNSLAHELKTQKSFHTKDI